MKPILNRKRFSLYLWIGAAYLLFWLIHVWVYFPNRELVQRSFNELWRSIYVTGFNYLLFEVTVRSIRQNRTKIFLCVLVIFGQFVLSMFGLYLWRLTGIHLHSYTVFVNYPSIGKEVGAQFSATIMSIMFFGVVRHLYDHVKLKQTAQRLRIEKQEAELNYLKAQTNPHFLFNTLNNIYSLSRDKSDLAPESILRLSKILRFMLYETGGDFINIEQEIKIISDYIALEQLRYDDSLRVNFTHEVGDMKQPLPPLLLMPLVENAFKHGVSETRDQPFVDIHLLCNHQHLTFFVKNSTEDVPEEKNVKESIGLSNLRRQLELLYKDYHLSVQQGASVFTATLQINLASHV